MLNRFSCTSRIYTTRVSTAISAHISGMSNGIITNDEADVLHPAARAAPIDVSKMANPLSPELFAKLSNTPKTVELQTKVRQHVNPLSTRHQMPIELPNDWIQKKFANVSNPFVIDIGCAKGAWGLQYAQLHPTTNVVGIEIREPMVELANARAERLGIPNSYYICTNANVNLTSIAEDINKHSAIMRIAINFPDPHFKKRNFKRRLVNNAFVRSLAQVLQSGAEVCFQSDVLELCEFSIAAFASGPWFEPCTYHDINDLTGNVNPTGVMTEREISVLKRNLSVYRISYVRTDAAVSSLPFALSSREASDSDDQEDLGIHDVDGEDDDSLRHGDVDSITDKIC